MNPHIQRLIDAAREAKKERDLLALAKNIFEAEGNLSTISFPTIQDFLSVLSVEKQNEQLQSQTAETEEEAKAETSQQTEQSKEILLQDLPKDIASKQLQTLATSPESRQGEFISAEEFTTFTRKAEITINDLNSEQLQALELALSGQSFCLIGAAGTGKTTIMRLILQEMIRRGMCPPCSFSTKYLSRGLPGVVVLSFTNKAVANIRSGMPKDITCVTVHKVIEFQPVYYEVVNVDGELVKTMRFEPARNLYNKLPFIAVTAIEEGSTVSTILHDQLLEGMQKGGQFIYMGDIQQLPPVYGQAILGFKMLELPVVELKTVMRQALDSNILAFAWKMLEGKPLKIKDIVASYNKEGEFFIRPWKKKVKADEALHVLSLLFNKFIDAKEYNPFEDMILIPFARNRSGENHVCTDELNKNIAQKLGTDRKAVVYEIIAGYQKHYFAEGDKILVNKQEAIITKIKVNADYGGKYPIDASTTLNRWGYYEVESAKDLKRESKGLTLEELELMMANTPASGDIEEKKNQASHILVCKMLDNAEEEIEVRTAGDYANSGFAYCLTVHKAQGSEWKKVFLVLHWTHATAISRELLYTAVTRAKKELYIMCEADHFEKGIIRQRIKGNTLEEKAEYFKGKLPAKQALLPVEEEEE